MKKRLFFRCNGGHYFQGLGCPFDGWTMEGVAATVELFEGLRREGKAFDEESIRAKVPSPDLMRRVLLVEFGDDSAVFEALVPERYMYRGHEVVWSDTGEGLN